MLNHRHKNSREQFPLKDALQKLRGKIAKSYARRFSLGLLFTTAAMVAGSKLHTPAKSTETPAKSDPNTGHHGRYTKSSTNPSSKDNLAHATSNPKTQTHNQGYQDYAGDIIHRERYGNLPKGTKPMSLEEWMSTQLQ